MKRAKRKDRMTKAQRSYCMSRVKSKHTSLELIVAASLKKEGLKFKRHVSSLPGKPDFVFPKEKVIVFVDGDFWHGWRFTRWKSKLAPYWKEKIEGNMKRDRRNFSKLRRQGWTVIRVWEHSVRADLTAVIKRIERAVA